MNKKWIAVLFMTAAACNAKVPNVKTEFEDRPMPEFSLLLADSSGYINTANLANGKPIVYFYYSPDCPYCRAQMEDMASNMEDMENIDFCILTSASYREMKEFYDHFKLKQYPNITAGLDTGFVFLRYFKVNAVPYTAIYGKDGKLKHTALGKLRVEVIKSIALN